MNGLEYKITVPRRQAMLKIGKMVDHGQWGKQFQVEAEVPVLVWPMPTLDGFFIVEHQDGHCQKVEPHELTFLGSKELFDQYIWEKE